MIKKYNFDILVIGGGHAGIEAAWIASQFSLNIGLITMPGLPLASAPCNPAIGGVGKGQVVREIDAMGGIMGLLADKSGIQYRTLNESKGYAVHSTRVQVDKELYAKNAEKMICDIENITLFRQKVLRVEKKGEFFKAEVEKGDILQGKKLILTTGTFLNGKLHQGSSQQAGGRVGIQNSVGLNEMISSVKKISRPFKTGTPPRLKKNSVKFSLLKEQKSDGQSLSFHWNHRERERPLPQVSCFLAQTTEKTMKIIRQNKDKSPLFNGQIVGVGPRYCPSIEDKAFRYPQRNRHHIFIEPEGLHLDTVYPSGLSSALPLEIQQQFINTIPGLEKAQIAVAGYAVEYDVLDTSQLTLELEHREIKGLYFAGQVNGTSGYEEAAGQGLVAGANSALALKNKDPLIFKREDSYIGVMIEDLIHAQRDEPYRLFTARSENRLFIREDNSVMRMAPYREKLALKEKVDKYNKEFVQQYIRLQQLCDEYCFKETEKSLTYFAKYNLGPIRHVLLLKNLLKRSTIDPVVTLTRELASMEKSSYSFKSEVVRCVAISMKYRDYIERAKRENSRIHGLAGRAIDWKDLAENSNISNECRQRIGKYGPKTFAQLQKIEGIRPATLAFVAGRIIHL